MLVIGVVGGADQEYSWCSYSYKMPIALRFSFDNISINDYVTPNVERVHVYVSL